MKCQARLNPDASQQLRVIMFRNEEYDKWLQERFDFDLADYEECGGEIIAKVDAVDEPDYRGGSYASLWVTFRCKKCKCNRPHPDLPNDSNISEWLTEVIKKL